jgi:hypothetical protein
MRGGVQNLPCVFGGTATRRDKSRCHAIGCTAETIALDRCQLDSLPNNCAGKGAACKAAEGEALMER